MAPRIWCALVSWSVLALIAPPVRAQARRAPPTDLVYTRGPWTQACGDVQALKRVAVEELGYDPFDETAARKLRVSIAWREGKLTADMELRDEAGKSVWVNFIATTSPCRVLVDAVGFSIALRIHPRPPPPPTPSCPVCPACASAEPAKPPPVCEAAPETEPLPPPLVAPPSTPTVPEAKTALSFRLGAGVWLGQVLTDGAAVGFTVDAGIRYGVFGAAIEAHVDPPLSTPVALAGSVSFARATGALLLCARFQWLVGCAKGEAGRLFVQGNVFPNAYAYGAAGLQLGFELPAAPRLSVRVMGEVLRTINPATIGTLPNLNLVQVAGANAGLVIGVVYSFGAGSDQ